MSSTTLPPKDPSNTDNEDEIYENLEHGGVHVDVDYEFPYDPLQPKVMRGVATHFGKRTNNFLLDHKDKKEQILSQISDTLKAWTKASKVRIETPRARTEALLARARRYKSGTSSEVTSAGTNNFSITKCMTTFKPLTCQIMTFKGI